MASMVKIRRRVRRLAPADRAEGAHEPLPPAVDLRSAVTASGSRGGVVDNSCCGCLPAGAIGGARVGKPTPCRYFRMAPGSVRAATTCTVPPQRSHTADCCLPAASMPCGCCSAGSSHHQGLRGHFHPPGHFPIGFRLTVIRRPNRRRPARLTISRKRATGSTVRSATSAIRQAFCTVRRYGKT